MAISASCDKPAPPEALTRIRLSGRRVLRLVYKPRPRLSRLLLLLLSLCLPVPGRALDGAALPSQGEIKVGSGGISQNGATLTIQQNSNRLGVDWQSFNIGGQARVQFNQPGRDAVALNRVVGNSGSEIYGKLSANGQVFLSNPNGVLFAPGAKVDVGGLVATTLDMSQADFAAGKSRFQGKSGGAVANHGEIKAAEGGYVALFAPKVSNTGQIAVPSGRVVLAAGRAVTVEISGGGLISAVVEQGADDARVENSGSLRADGGVIRMDARAATGVVSGLVNNSGIVRATTLVEKNGEIWLGGDSVSNTGDIRAEGAAGRAGGEIHLEGRAVALGGNVSADGAQGGQIQVSAGERLTLAEQVSAKGTAGDGGRIEYVSGGGILENSGSHSDASGAVAGGVIEVHAASGVASSGHYAARGETGAGGRIDVSGDSVHLLAASLDASGASRGGLIRIGGGFQGGKHEPDPADPGNEAFVLPGNRPPVLANARATFINDGTTLDVGGGTGRGGVAIIWSDEETTFLGGIEAAGAAGGGAVEISSGELLKHADLADVHPGAGGRLLLDPKNILIGNPDQLKEWRYAGLLESIYAWKAGVPVLGYSDFMGSALALSDDARLLAVGTPGDDGAGNSRNDSGAVHLFQFADGDFGGGSLVGTLGYGYAGGRNINLTLGVGDRFGGAVALNGAGNLLAVGAPYGDGKLNNISDVGEVYLFSFSDTAFSGGIHEGTLGYGYSGGKNLSVNNINANDHFGAAVALNGDGTIAAIGAPGDDVGTTTNSGSVHLFGFAGSSFSGVAEYPVTLKRDVLLPYGVQLDSEDNFGQSVALDEMGDRLVVGASGDDGFANGQSNTGAVYLFDVDVPGFLIATLGHGYSGAHDIDPGLAAEDNFGHSVALSNDSRLLVVGAPNDDGQLDGRPNSGAAYLFGFAGSDFTAGSIKGRIGNGYTSAGDVAINLTGDGHFGYAAALNGAGDRLAVGAPWDDGAGTYLWDAGAVHLFGFADNNFGQGRILGSIGSGYRDERGTHIELGSAQYWNGDQAGAAVALSGNARLLAIGAPYDDGGGQHAISNGNTGAVHLIAFSDGSFNGGQLVGSIGEGYVGLGNVNLDLDSEDRFGAAVALDPDGRSLAVGAPGDDGYGNVANNTGALYLFGFSNDIFGGGSLKARIAHGTAAGDDKSVALNDGDAFGGSVALDDGHRLLAVGAPYDDGFDNQHGDSGAVLLFNRLGDTLDTYALHGRMGAGYLAPGDYNLALDDNDLFGAALALSGAHNLLAVGAPSDAGQGNVQAESGAVYLFEFGDAFSGGTLRGRIGQGYSGAGDSNLHLDVSDRFGSAVALNADGTHLAVGAPSDDGSLGFNPWLNDDNRGAVHLFTFADSHFGGGSHVGSIGRGYAGARDVSLDLDAWDGFGSAVALDASGTRLAVGAPSDDGYSNVDYESGAAHLFSFSGAGFTGGSLAARLGRGYSQGARDIPLNLSGYDYSTGDQVGQALALSDDGLLLAIGVPDHDGADTRWDTSRGAVHLVTFSGGEFEDGELVGSIGYGFQGGKNVDLTVYEGERFGASVALNGDGTLLAVGVPGHNGAGNDRDDSGAVYFFQFADTAFSGGQRIGILGHGYSGEYSGGPALDSYDYFGTSVALDSSGTLLAVGATGDDGAGNGGSNTGAVHTFHLITCVPDCGGTFWLPVGTLGRGYSGGQNLSVSLEENDGFGQSLALDDAGRHLVVGAPGDHGSGNAGPDQSGAVHLFTFGANFTSPLKRGTLGFGYSGGQSYDVSLDAEDRFGGALALSGNGLNLLVGAPGDDGGGNAISNSGVVYLFDFTDAGYAVPSPRGRIGSDYSGPGDIPTWNWDWEQRLGSGLALDSAATRLAVGAPGDNGVSDAAYNAGAVHLYTLDLSTPGFSGYEIHTVGRGYGGASGVTAENWRNSGGHAGDRAGSAVALSGDARLLAVGAPYDQGPGASGPLWSQYGAVHLFTFADGDFGGGALAGSLGHGYTGAGNLDLPLGTYDRFGAALSLNTDGSRLAVGAPGGGSPWLSGQVRLIGFSDSQFHAPTLLATLGNGASGGKDVSVDLEQYDNFGTSLALSGDATRLAVGAPYDDGSDNLRGDSGAVYLFTFSDGNFSGGTLAGRVGRGYGGLSGTSVDLDNNDQFGRAVALNAAGNRLLVGAPLDDGNADTLPNSGAVYAFQADDFATPTLVGTLGAGYAGLGGLGFTPDDQDNFGTALALDATGRHLVVGATGDDGFANAWGGAGALHLFTFADGNFGGGVHAGTVGRGYAGSGDVDTQPEWINLGEAAALDGGGTRLAAGTPYYDGGGDAVPEGGGVYLYGFSGDAFQGGRLLARVGHGGRDGSKAGLELPVEGSGSSRGDELGAAVALSADASLLAVGAPGQDGSDGQRQETGAVHLFSLGGATYLNASLVGSLGQGFSGGNDLDLVLEAGDLFGSALALNASGDRLVVGAPGDDGAGNAAPDSGAAWLIRFGGANFTGPSLAGRIGKGYAGAGDYAVDLGNGDAFGSALALTADARQLAIGAPLDDGAVPGRGDTGAVWLINFTDSTFAGASLAGRIGYGYSGGNDLNLELDGDDRFASGLALSADGRLLAIGAPRGSGANNAWDDSGEVHLIRFGGAGFSLPERLGRIGRGYTGAGDIDFTLDSGDIFGSALALNAAGDRLAIGAPGDNGYGNAKWDTGAVHVFDFSAADFAGGGLLGSLGYGYLDGGGVSAKLSDGDALGFAVALDAAGDTLAAGVTRDDGVRRTTTDTGAVRLYRLDGGGFSNSPQLLAVGQDRAPTSFSFPTVSSNDRFGAAIALGGNLLAVGAPGDDGFANDRADAGAVHVFSIGDSDFSGLALLATYGHGYVGGGNLDLLLDWGDGFGGALAFDSVGSLLAVGAPGDDGADNHHAGAGAVHLLAVNPDASASRVGVMGQGYTGGHNVNLTLDDFDAFGGALAMNADGTRLAVGAPYDDGAANDWTDAGAVHLFHFDAGFGNGARVGIMGHDYTGPADVRIESFDPHDHFGAAVALNGDATRMAVGAPGDDGANHTEFHFNRGAVHLFSFDNGDFLNGTALDRIGYGYSGVGGSALESDDEQIEFGAAVALDASGTILAVGAPAEDDFGTVRVIQYADGDFGGGRLVGTLGNGRTGAGDVNVGGDWQGRFGAALALDGPGRRLLVGAPFNDHTESRQLDDTGNVSLFEYATLPVEDPTFLGFGDYAGDQVGVDVADLANLLGNGVSVTLQANNDIWLLSDLSYLPSSPVELTLQAGRSVHLLGNIEDTVAQTTLKVTANAATSMGVDPAERDPGAATISMAPGTYIQTDGLQMRLADGDGLYDSISGDINLQQVVARTITIENLGATPGSDIVVNEWISGFGDVIIATINGSLVNSYGQGAITTHPLHGRWLVYTGSPADTQENGLVADAMTSGSTRPRLYDIDYAANPPASIEAGNHLLYRYQPTLTVRAVNKSITYGATDPLLSYSVSGQVDDDGVKDSANTAGLLLPDLTLPATAGRRDAGAYTISVNVNTSGSPLGYAFYGQNGLLTVNPLGLSLSGLVVATREYDGSRDASLEDPAALDNVLNGVLPGDDVSLIDSGAVYTFDDKNAGFDKPVSVAGLALDGIDRSNYFLVGGSATGSILPRSLTLSGTLVADKVYDGQTTAGVSHPGSLQGLVGGETVGISMNARFADKNVGIDKLVSLDNIVLSNGSGLAGNYVVDAYATPRADITPKPLTVTGLTAQDKVYDGNSSAQVTGTASFDGKVLNDELFVDAAASSAAFADKRAGADKPVSLNNLVLTGADAGNYSATASLGSADITPKPLTVTGLTAQDKVYDGNSSAQVTGTASFDGKVLNDELFVDAAASSAAFADKRAGADKPVGLNNLVLTGADAGNYSATASLGSADITPKPLTVTGLTAQDKVYDGNSTAQVTGTASFDGKVLNDELFVDAAASSAAFADKRAGADKPVSLNNLVLTGADAGNYAATASLGTADITPKPLTVTGLTAQDKVYDGTVAAQVSGTASFDGKVLNDELFVDAAASSAAFADKHAGADKPVSLNNLVLTGADAGNYSATASLGGADITPKPLTVTGLTAQDKVYDGNSTAQVTGTASFDGKVLNDELFVDAAASSAAFADKRAGADKPVSLNNLVLTGADAGNYAATASLGTADITPKPLTVTGLTAQDKVYDGNSSAQVTGTASFDGKVLNDELFVDAAASSAAFADKHAGADKPVSLNNLVLTGADAGNYSATASLGSADITPKPLTVTGLTAQDKVYDGTVAAQVSGTAGFEGKIAGDDVEVDAGAASAAFQNANAGVNLPVSLNGLALSGADAGNYSFIGSLAATASILPRPLTIAANNVLRFAGEPNPNPFPYSSNSDGLVGDDQVFVTIPEPAGSPLAVGGTVFNLIPARDAVFNPGNAGNYAVSYANGYLVVLPKPSTDVAGGQSEANLILSISVNPAELEDAMRELARQHAERPAGAGSAFLTLAPLSVSATEQPPDAAEVQRLLQAMLAGQQGASHTLLATLRGQPLLIWQPALLDTLLNPSR